MCRDPPRDRLRLRRDLLPLWDRWHPCRNGRRAFASSYDNWTIEYDFHCGGFAKKSPELQAFIDAFKARHGLVLDWVYVAKMLYGIFALTERGELERGTRVVAVITG